MRHLGILVAACVLVAGPSAVAAAQDDKSVDVENMTVNELVDVLQDRRNPWTDRACTVGVPVHAELNKRIPGRDFIQSGLLLAEALCADENDEYALGAAKVAELEALSPEQDFTGLGLYFARQSEDAPAALERLRGLTDKQMSGLGREQLWAVGRMLNEQGATTEYEALALHWANSGKLGLFDIDLQSSLARNALISASASDETVNVDGMLALIRRPRSYTDMLADRRLEPFWPQIEERAGVGLTAITAEFSDWALARLDTNEGDRDRFSDAAHALHFEGRFDEAVKLAQSWRNKQDDLDTIKEGDGWALNIQAYAYDALGETDKADAVFDALAAIDYEENYWVVNFVINRASRLIGRGRWEEGLEAAKLAREVAKENGSPYAKMIVAEDHACALTKLGRDAEAEAELEYLRENWKDSATLAASGLMCAGKRDEAASLVRTAIADERYRDGVIGNLQADKFELFYAPSILPGINDLLSDYPELRADFEKYARAIPDEYTPAAHGLRKDT